ncbi:MAG: hypothetical protein APR62_01890 [Smithella sp. SDB]|nr:MAG: hypothetical protein APR62_01890 [Smithella sp. SDB]
MERDILRVSTSSSEKTALRFWEIDSMFRCPVIGMCLTESEQIAILRKAGVPSKDKNSFEIHELLVASAGSENQLSFRIDHFLWKKFGEQASHIHSFDENDMLEHWREFYRKGDYLAIFWGVVTRPQLSDKAKYEIFGTVHMSMHKTTEKYARDRQRLVFLESCLTGQDEKIRMLGTSRRQLQKDYDDLACRAASLQSALDDELRKKISSARQPVVPPEEQRIQTDAENQRLRDALAEKTQRTDEFERLVAQLEKTVAQYAKALNSQKELQAKLRQETEYTIGILLNKTRCSENCPSFNLCRKRILIVGGIARMESQYRRIIEEGGGVLEYHEGNIKGGTRQLENSLRRADIVLCPVNCNSHAACSIVKNMGKKHKKPVHMLPNFSLSAITQALSI